MQRARGNWPKARQATAQVSSGRVRSCHNASIAGLDSHRRPARPAHVPPQTHTRAHAGPLTRARAYAHTPTPPHALAREHGCSAGRRWTESAAAPLSDKHTHTHTRCKRALVYGRRGVRVPQLACRTWRGTGRRRSARAPPASPPRSTGCASAPAEREAAAATAAAAAAKADRSGV
jgi:hypothetical protein